MRKKAIFNQDTRVLFNFCSRICLASELGSDHTNHPLKVQHLVPCGEYPMILRDLYIWLRLERKDSLIADDACSQVQRDRDVWKSPWDVVAYVLSGR
mmetsp:Transcript_135/g.132  ORF Transcript_135/g.132 Transcript_135/m.132 type:complete len:97 (-) Transcript_135:478-768(-)